MLAAVAGAARGQATRPTASAAAPTPENRSAFIREHYTKYEYRIPMRDGVRLFTTAYIPKDDSTSYPILMTRTPYTVKPYGEDVYTAGSGTMNYYAAEKFIFVFQDVRGKNGSEGTFVDMRPIKENKGPKDTDESTDAYDSIDWLVKNIPNNNGKVGIMGISYPGFYSACAMIDSHPALKCVSPQAPITDWFIGDDFHHNGAFYLPHNFGFFSGFGQKLDNPIRDAATRFDYGTNDGYKFYLAMGPVNNSNVLYFHNKFDFWNQVMDHPNYDEFWQARNLRPHLHNVKAAVMTVGGWFDAEDLFGALAVYKETERQNPGINNVLVMGPWYHGEWASPDGDHLGNENFNAKTAQYYRENMELPFLNHYLKEDANIKLAEANVFETGTNIWRKYDAWPPKSSTEKSIYLHSGGKLSFDPPAANEGAEFDEYISDPAKPVPYIGYIAIGMTREHMVDDQRFAATRPDVLVYQTDALDQDVTFSGPISASLMVSTTGTDSDFVVKLIDVYSDDFPNPDAPNDVSSLPIPRTSSATPVPAVHPPLQMGGYEQLVRGEAMRGKFRSSYEKPEPFTPGQVAKVDWTMPDINHTFRRGHRIMIQVQSTWFPLVDRNPQKFVENIYKASPEDFQKATERIYHSPQNCSQLHVRLLSPG